MDLAETLSNLTPVNPLAKHQNMFAHCSSLSLGGGRAGCYYVECRKKRVSSLARFAALYSDKIYVRSYFADYDHYLGEGEEELRQLFKEDLDILAQMQPIFEAGIIEFMGGHNEVMCPRCLSTSIGFGKEGEKRLAAALSNLSLEYLDNTTYSIESDGDSFFIHMKGPELYYEHGGRVIGPYEAQDILPSKPRLMKKLIDEGKLDLSKAVAKKTNIHKILASEVAQNINYEITMKELLGTSFLTDNEIHLKFLDGITDDYEIAKRNVVAHNYLTTMVPFLADVSLRGLLKLRDREADSFLQFRAALNKSIDEFRANKGNFSKEDAVSLRRDIIDPKLAILDKRVKEAKKDLASTAFRSLVGTVGAISFGLYTGIVPQELAAIAKALGFVKFGADMIQKIMALGDGSKAIKQDDLYFLWKVRQQAKS